MALARWNPTYPGLSVRDAIDRLFDDSVWWPMRAGFAPYAGDFQAPMDVYAEGDGYVVEVALPGLSPEQIDVKVEGNVLTITGQEQLAPEGRQYLVRQRPNGQFQTTVTLPESADAAQAKATFEHGVLKLEIPKAESAKPKRIPLSAGT